jgi:hypothetical protein
MNTRPIEASDQEDDRQSSNAQDTAPSIAENSTEAAASLGAEMKKAAQATSKAIRKQAANFAREVGHELGATAEEQRARGAEAIKAFSRAMTAAAAELAEQSPAAARYARDAAHTIDDLSRSIRDRSATALMHSATEVARSQPMLFFAGAIAAGFSLSRFLKSSAAHEHRGRKEHADE